MPMQYNNGVTMELASYGIISQAGSTQAMEFDYDNEIILKYFLQPWVAELINKDEQLKEKYKKSKQSLWWLFFMLRIIDLLFTKVAKYYTKVKNITFNGKNIAFRIIRQKSQK